MATDKMKAVEFAVEQIERQFGTGAIMRLGENPPNVAAAAILSPTIRKRRAAERIGRSPFPDHWLHGDCDAWYCHLFRGNSACLAVSPSRTDLALQAVCSVTGRDHDPTAT